MLSRWFLLFFLMNIKIVEHCECFEGGFFLGGRILSRSLGV